MQVFKGSCRDAGRSYPHAAFLTDRTTFGSTRAEVLVRKATPADFDQLVPLFDAYRVFYNRRSYVEGARKFLSDRMNNNESEVFVADNDGMLTGFVRLYPLFSSARMKTLWLLNDLFIHPDRRGKRISVALIEAAKELCRASGSCGMQLETEKNNLIGNSLYDKTGWELDTEHHFYFWGV